MTGADQSNSGDLQRIWKAPSGWRLPTNINNTSVGLFYLGAAFFFFLLAGVLALIMRAQLAVPETALVSQGLYNQLFTVHGTAMMFLFAVPAVEALGVLLLPQMLSARDLPFPRLSAFAVWSYVIGGLVFFSTLFFDLAPDGGWFMYPPLTNAQFSPGANADFWLLGIGFIEISAIAGAIEIIVAIMKTRPPGMTLDKLPLFGWAMLVFAGMILIAFPALILATILLELERAFGWPIFSPAGGGDPLLWQHLFWFFGHPEVYIIFLPAAGLVSTMIPALAGAPLVAHRLIVVALVATGFFSFGLWVHHMFTTGLPALSLAFFSAASMAVAIPSGIQVFSWIATFASSKKRLSLTTPTLFILGMLVIFTLGGLTGVMVAMAPFDWQAHDTYFIVAHLHYVLIGGMVFPLFAGLYYWAPMVSRRRLSETYGRTAFGLMFIGFNVAFMPMHLAGLMGMPRRIWSYPADIGWDGFNLASTVGAYLFAAGVLVVLIDFIRNFRFSTYTEQNPWGAGTLEWLPGDAFTTRPVPHVSALYPLWEDPGVATRTQRGEDYLPNAPTGERETIITSAIEAEPQYLARMPGPGWAHVLAAAFMAGFFLMLAGKMIAPAFLCGVLAIVMIHRWTWENDKGHLPAPVPIGRGVSIPAYASGPVSHGWWAMILVMIVAGSLFIAYLFSYLYLWTSSPSVWPQTAENLAPLSAPFTASTLMSGSALSFVAALGTLRPRPGATFRTPALIMAGAALAAGAVGVDALGHWRAGLRPEESSYAAMTYAAALINAVIVLAVAIMSISCILRALAGRLDSSRRASLENTALLAWYAAAQFLIGLVFLHGFPRMAL